jgi:hypothetical protein
MTAIIKTASFSLARRTFARHGAALLLAPGVSLVAARTACAAAPAVNVPGSSSMTYSLKASAKGFKINVDSHFDWMREGDAYRIVNSGRFTLFSFNFESSGVITPDGLQPARYQETRNKRIKAVTFDPEARKITFAGGESEPLQAGTQDRMSVLVQLAAMGRKNPDVFASGKVVPFRVAGSSRTGMWRFRVAGTDTLDTPLGPVKAVHLVRERDEDDGQKVEVWLSADYDWMPVRVLSNESDGDFLDQVLSKFERK